MKVRAGFVSNSSSSSFCILGTTYSRIQELQTTKENSEDTQSPLDDDEDKDESLNTLLADSFLIYHYGIANYFEDYVVGMGVHQIKDEETLYQAKSRVSTEINKVFKIAIEPNDISFCVDGGSEY